MTKWILAFVALLAVSLFIWTERTGTKTAYVNGLVQYNTLPGREYIFERDCYIFKFKHHPTTYPLIGANAPDLSATVAELPSTVTPDNIGKDLPEVRLLDVVRTGSRFRLVSVRRDQSRKKTSITFELLFVDEAERKYPRVDAQCILDHSPEEKGEAPRILEGYAVERVKK
jgi:hypothetical protein